MTAKRYDLMTKGSCDIQAQKNRLRKVVRDIRLKPAC